MKSFFEYFKFISFTKNRILKFLYNYNIFDPSN